MRAVLYLLQQKKRARFKKGAFRMSNSVLYAAWAFAAGVLIPVMMILNGHLGRALGSSWIAVSALFLTGFLTSLVFMAIARPVLPNLAAFSGVPPQFYMGGCVVAFYILSVTILAPKFGVGNTVMFVVMAQLCSSAMIDAWGLFGAAVRPVTALRLAGLAIIVAGVIVTQAAARVQAPSGP